MGKYEKEKLKPKNDNKTRIDQQSYKPEKTMYSMMRKQKIRRASVVEYRMVRKMVEYRMLILKVLI